MKTDVRFPPLARNMIAALLTVLLLFASSGLFLRADVANAQTRNFDQRLASLRAELNLLIRRGNLVPALTKAKRLVFLTAKKYGTRHPDYARALHLQAKVYRRLKRPADARKLELRAAVILKNHQNFKAKRTADIKAARAKAKQYRRDLQAKMARERRALRSLKKQKKSQPAKPQAAYKKQNRPAKSKPIANSKPSAKSPTRSARTYGTAKPRSSYQPNPQTSRATRSPPKPAPQRNMRTLRPKPGQPDTPATVPNGTIGLERANKIAKSVAPPTPQAAPPVPLVIPRSAVNGATSGAGPQIESGAEPEASPAPAPNKTNYTIVKVYYATDRQRTNSKQLASIYSGQPADPIRISYGICEVSIPKGHKPGQLEAPSIYRFEFKEDPNKHVVLLNVHQQQKKTYFRNLKDVIARSKGENAFIFIHGYNVTFSDAARRTAQISYDLGFDGAPVFYSWPSTGELSGYPNDEDNILWAQENVKQFLKDFVELTDAKNIYLVAHSMGSRALTGAVASLISEAPKFKKRFKEIILAAPDISARIFKDHIAPKMLEASNNVTLYVSADDKALLASRNFHSNPRAGEAGENIIIFKGIDTIDATGVDASLLAHSYLAEAKSIIWDILAVLRGDPPHGRKTLKPVETKRGTYWAFTK